MVRNRAGRAGQAVIGRWGDGRIQSEAWETGDILGLSVISECQYSRTK